MINLLPPDGKRRVVKEYWMRITALGFFVSGSTVLLLGVLTLPAYFNVIFQLDAFTKQYDLTEEAQTLDEIEKEFSVANAVSDLLLDTPEYIDVKVITETLLGPTGGDISIQSVRLNKNGRVIESIEMGGSAVDRAALVSFRDQIEAHEYFDDVDLPISNLAKNENIPFTLVVTTSDLARERI